MALKNRTLVSGTLYFRLDGRQYSFQGDMECKDSSEKKVPVPASDGVVGYRIEHEGAPMIKAKLLLTPDVDPKLIFDVRDATLVAEDRDTGRRFTLRSAWYSGERNLNWTQGTIDAEFSGLEGRWKKGA